MNDHHPSQDLLNAMDRDPPSVAIDRLEAIRQQAATARDLDAQISDLEQRLKELDEQRETILKERLPEMLDAIGMREFVLERSGNMPAVKLKLSAFYSAGISAKWPIEKRKAAYTWLDANGHGDLIKTEVAVPFQRESRGQALMLKEKLEEGGYSVEVEEAVHARTLTAWLKEMVESGHDLPPLDVIGGFIGRVVKMEEIDD
jgi:hypothetical protein